MTFSTELTSYCCTTMPLNVNYHQWWKSNPVTPCTPSILSDRPNNLLVPIKNLCSWMEAGTESKLIQINGPGRSFKPDSLISAELNSTLLHSNKNLKVVLFYIIDIRATLIFHVYLFYHKLSLDRSSYFEVDLVWDKYTATMFILTWWRVGSRTIPTATIEISMAILWIVLLVTVVIIIVAFAIVAMPVR